MKNLPAFSPAGPLLPSVPSSTFTTGSCFTSLVAGTEPLRTAPVPLILAAGRTTLGDMIGAAGDSAAPSVSNFCRFGFRDFTITCAGRTGSVSLAERRAKRISMFLITSLGSSFRIFSSSSASLTPSRYRAASSSISVTVGATGDQGQYIGKSKNSSV